MYHRRRARPPGPARQGAGPNARSRAPRPGLRPGPLALRRQARGLSPVQAASDARARLPAPRRSVPQAGPGSELPMRGGPHGRSLASPRPAPPSASARSRRLQTPGRVYPAPRRSVPQAGPGAELPMRGGPHGRSFASPRPAPPSASARSRRLQTPGRASPRLGGPRLRTKACNPSATASALPLGRPSPRKDTSRLRGGHRSPHAPGPSRRDGAPAPGYGRPTAGRRPGLGSVGVRSWRPGRRQRPCHRALCVLTRRGCPII